MNEQLIKSFNILISTPSDMIRFVNSVESIISKYNNDYLLENHIFYKSLFWKEDTHPTYGETAQDSINEQIVSNSTIVIALFGARIGTPTENFDSGTLEEMERIHKSGGHVLTYFYIGDGYNVNDIDNNQLEKIKKFKKEFKGLYNEFKTEKDLQELIINSLKKISKKLVESKFSLSIYSYDGVNLKDNLVFETYDFMNSKKIEKIKKDINDILNNIIDIDKENEELDRKNKLLIESLQSTEAINKIKKVNELTKNKISYNKELLSTLKEFNNTINPRSEIIFSDNLVGLIKRYANENEIKIDDNIMNIGDAHYKGLNLVIGDNREICGTDNEIRKIKLLFKVNRLLEEYYTYLNFFNQIQGLFLLSLVIKNEGNIFAEDISIKIFIPKKYYFDIKTITLEDENISKEIINFPSEVLDFKDNVDIDNIDYNKVIYPMEPVIINNFFIESKETSLHYLQEYFDAEIDKIYPYIQNEKNENIVLRFDIKRGLKQFSTKFISGKLMLKQIPEYIDYTITSKSIAHEIKGRIKYINN